MMFMLTIAIFTLGSNMVENVKVEKLYISFQQKIKMKIFLHFLGSIFGQKVSLVERRIFLFLSIVIADIVV